VRAAAIQAKAQGNFPAGMARSVERALRPRVDVRSLLLRFFQDRAPSDYSWTRPNLHYIAQGLYLPALHDVALGEVAVMVDTSGSVDDVALAKARSIVESVLEECNPAGVTLVFADAEVNHVQRMEKGEPLTWEPTGGGGTDFRPALEHINAGEETQYVCAVCITDLYGTFPDVAPDVPVIWLSTTEDLTAPFGETVYVGD
jgi:predicted metal-dependent peptidase